jgi:hypothetical protein
MGKAAAKTMPCKRGVLVPHPAPALFKNGNEEGEEGVRNVAFEPPTNHHSTHG